MVSTGIIGKAFCEGLGFVATLKLFLFVGHLITCFVVRAIHEFKTPTKYLFTLVINCVVI